MRRLVPRRIEHHGDLHLGDALRPWRRHSPPSPASRRPPGSPARSASCRWRHVRSSPISMLVDQAELVDVGRDLRVVDRLERARRCRRSCRSISSGGERGADRRHRRRRFGVAPSLDRCRSSCPSLSLRVRRRTSCAFDQAPRPSASTSSSGVVERRTRPGRSRSRQSAASSGMGAMGAGAHRHPCAVDDRRDVMGMGALHLEGDDGALARAPRRRCGAS